MENIKLNIEKTLDFISKEKLASYEPKVKACMETLDPAALTRPSRSAVIWGLVSTFSA